MKWVKTEHRGIRFREHQTRKHGIRKDRYYSIRYKLNGKDVEEGLGWETEWKARQKETGRSLEQEAILRLSEVKSNQRSGEGPITLREKRDLAEQKREVEREEAERRAKESLTFREVFTEHYFPIAKANKTQRSWAREESLFRLWIDKAIGGLPLKDIGPLHLERLKKRMADAGKAPRSTLYAIQTIRQVFNYAVRNDLYGGKNPANLVRKPAPDNRRLRFLSHEEAETLLEALKPRSKDLHDMTLLSLHCGLRAGEIFALTWGDVNFDQGVLTLRDTKSGRTRNAYLTDRTKAMIEARPHGGPDHRVFPARGTDNPRAAISKRFMDVVKELGLNAGVTDRRRKVTFHTCRHTYASWLCLSGVDLYTVKNLMGHQTFAMTERYAKLTGVAMRGAVTTFEEGMKTHGKVIELTK